MRTHGVGFSLYVDDGAQHVVDKSPTAVAGVLTNAASSFLTAAKAMKLKVASKTTIVASRGSITAAVQERLGRRGLHVTSDSAARDLGVLLVVGARRRTQLVANRMAEGLARLRRSRWLVRISNKCRQTVRGNALSCGLLGVEAMGLSPRRIEELRAATAGASGINQSRRCPTAAIRAAFGRDPAAEIASRMVATWVKWLARGLGRDILGSMVANADQGCY